MTMCGAVEVHGVEDAAIAAASPNATQWTGAILGGSGMGTIEDVRELASVLPRSVEAVVRDRVKFRVARIVYIAFSRDETMMGFAFPKEERDFMIATEPDRYV